MADEGPVADDNGGSPVDVGVETSVPVPEHRLALAVVRMLVSAVRVGTCPTAEWGGWICRVWRLPPQEFANVADGDLGETVV